MRSKLLEEKAKTTQIRGERWVRVFPDKGDGYRLYDPIMEAELGRIIFDPDDNWIYDGDVLTVYEQEDIAGFISGSQKEMNELINSLFE